MEWLLANSGVVAVAAFALSLLVVIGNVLVYLFRKPRAIWVLEAFTLELPEDFASNELPRRGRAMFTFRNAGTGTAHLFTIRTKFPKPRWQLYGYQRDMTMTPGTRFEVHATGTLTTREDLKSEWSMGDGFWFVTDDVIKLTWTHHPSRIPWTTRKKIRLQHIQHRCVPKQVASLPPMHF